MKILILLLLIIVLFVAYVRYLEENTVFHPSRELTVTPTQAGLDYDDVYFPTEDGLKINGWLVKASNTASTLIFFHGNAGNIGDRVEKIEMFHKMGLNVFIVDYRGFGRSQGVPTEEGIYKDAIGTYDYLLTRKDIDLQKLVAYGASLGGAVAVDLASKRKVAALIIDSSFTNAADMAKAIFPFIPSFLIQAKMDSVSKINHITVPKLFLHSRTDETVPFELGEKLFRRAAEPKEFVELKGNHNDGYVISENVFQKHMRQFLQKYNLL